MNCRDFERYWNDRLEGSRLDEEAALGHARRCGRCSRLDVGYRRLERGLDRPTASAPYDPILADRILHRLAAPPDTVRLRRPPLRGPGLRLAAAACLLIGIVAIARHRGHAPDPSPPAAQVTPPAEPARPLDAVVADAASATLSLARDTSEPAGRLGREVIEGVAAGVPRPASSLASKPIPSPLGPASLRLERIGAGVQSGLRPIARPAGRAFSFLLPGPTPAPPDDSINGGGDA